MWALGKEEARGTVRKETKGHCGQCAWNKGTWWETPGATQGLCSGLGGRLCLRSNEKPLRCLSRGHEGGGVITPNAICVVFRDKAALSRVHKGAPANGASRGESQTEASTAGSEDTAGRSAEA